jgi:NAD-dependent dihydropyrimidine dehydrogenase PreA subunit
MATENPMLTELKRARVLRRERIVLDEAKCKGTWQCYEVCPIGCWRPNREIRKVSLHDPENLCIACGACVLQCPEDAIQLTVPKK